MTEIERELLNRMESIAIALRVTMESSIANDKSILELVKTLTERVLELEERIISMAVRH